MQRAQPIPMPHPHRRTTAHPPPQRPPHRPTAHPPPHRPHPRPAPPQPRPPHLWAYCSPSRGAMLSRSKTKNFDRMTSESSSSPRVITGSVRCEDPFSAGATPVADAPPTIARDIPAAPHTGRAFREGFLFETCFARAMAEPPVLVCKSTDVTLAFFRPPCHTGDRVPGGGRTVPTGAPDATTCGASRRGDWPAAWSPAAFMRPGARAAARRRAKIAENGGAGHSIAPARRLKVAPERPQRGP